MILRMILIISMILHIRCLHIRFVWGGVRQERAGLQQQHIAAFLSGAVEPRQIVEDANDRAILESVKAFLSERMQVGLRFLPHLRAAASL